MSKFSLASGTGYISKAPWSMRKPCLVPAQKGKTKNSPKQLQEYQTGKRPRGHAPSQAKTPRIDGFQPRPWQNMHKKNTINANALHRTFFFFLLFDFFLLLSVRRAVPQGNLCVVHELDRRPRRVRHDGSAACALNGAHLVWLTRHVFHKDGW